MDAELIPNPRGGYRFLRGIAPYSCGVIADPGWEIVHVRLARPLPWYDGLVSARRYVEGLGRERHHLCAVELRCPRPFSMEGFIAFNAQYRALLVEWDMLVGDDNPIARTNVAPVEAPPAETVLFGFSYAESSEQSQSTFVIAGAGELPEGPLEAERIVRAGEVSDAALLEKACCVVDILRARLVGLGAAPECLSTIDVYTAHPLRPLLEKVVIPALPSAAHLGVQWHYSRPPVEDIEFEMDMRGVRREVVTDLE